MMMTITIDTTRPPDSSQRYLILIIELITKKPMRPTYVLKEEKILDIPTLEML